MSGQGGRQPTWSLDLGSLLLLRPLHFRWPAVAQAMLVVDALNFCFYPEEGLEYEHLAAGVKQVALSDPGALSADRLATADAELVRRLFRWPGTVPLEFERARLLREIGAGLIERWGGQTAALVRAAGGSARRLVGLVLESFPGFRWVPDGAGLCERGRQG